MRRKCRMVSILLAGIKPSCPRSKDQALASAADPHRCPKLAQPAGRVRVGTATGFASETWPASERNGGRLRVGIHGRLQSEFAPDPHNDGFLRVFNVEPTEKCPREPAVPSIQCRTFLYATRARIFGFCLPIFTLHECLITGR